MMLAGILLLVSAFLCVLNIMLKSIGQSKPTHPVILFQGLLSMSLLLWSFIYLIFLVFFELEKTIHSLGLIVFLGLVFSYVITLSVSVLLTIAILQKFLAHYEKKTDVNYTYQKWYLKLIKIHLPLALLCFIIGVWDIIYITSIHSLIVNLIESL